MVVNVEYWDILVFLQIFVWTNRDVWSPYIYPSSNNGACPAVLIKLACNIFVEKMS